MVVTYRRNLDPFGIANGTGSLSVPGQSTFINLSLNQKPTYFGCNASNIATPGLLIMYLPNSLYSYYSNVLTFQLKYTDAVRNSIVQNGCNVATMGNGTIDTMWPICVGCASLSRSLDRTGVTVPAACQTCFTRYCWDGTKNDTTPEPYQPTLALQSGPESSEARKASSLAITSTLLVLLIFHSIHKL
jgi:lysophospholipase